MISVGVDGSFGVVVVAICLMTGVLNSTPLNIPAGWFWTEWWLKAWLDDPAVFVQPVLVMLAVNVFWTMAWELAHGRTPGAMLTRIEVVDADGDPPHPVRSLVRTLGIIINVCTLGLGFLWGFVAPSRRALHDLVSGTKVVHFDT